jgi:hypothetical protein
MLQTHTHTICNTYWFSSTTMVARTRLIVTFIRTLRVLLGTKYHLKYGLSFIFSSSQTNRYIEGVSNILFRTCWIKVLADQWLQFAASGFSSCQSAWRVAGGCSLIAVVTGAEGCHGFLYIGLMKCLGCKWDLSSSCLAKETADGRLIAEPLVTSFPAALFLDNFSCLCFQSVSFFS